MLRVGLTGGIGAGKSTVAATLAELGAVVVDADRVAREVVEPGTEGLAAVVEAFGSDVLDADGALDRPALGRVVFDDDEKRARLNGILHPRIGARTAELVADAPDDAVVVHDIPLLVENGMGAAFSLVLVVDAPVDVRVTRLADTRDMSAEDARARMAAQADDEARRAAADVWLDNAGPTGVVREQVETLWQRRIVPYAANLRAGRAVPLPTTVVDADPEWGAQARRVAARVAVACEVAGAPVQRVEHVGPTAVPGLPAPDVLDLLVVTDGGRLARRGIGATLEAAGFPALEKGCHASADPGRPTRLLVVDAKGARGREEGRDLARADPGRVAADPDAVRAELALG